jgi:hypothetical protein
MDANLLFPMNGYFSHGYLIKTKVILGLSFANISINLVAWFALSEYAVRFDFRLITALFAPDFVLRS